MKMGEEGSCKESFVEGIVRDRSGRLGNLGGLIEEEMGKVSLEGVSDGSAVMDANGTVKSDEIVGIHGNGTKGGELVTVECESEKNGEMMGVVGDSGNSNEVVSVDGNGVKSSDVLTVNEYGSKSGETVSDGDESDSGSDSDSESESANSSPSSASSYASSEDDDEEEKKGEDKEEKQMEEEKGEVERDMDAEEGEIRGSHVEEMVAWSDEDDEEDGGGGSVKTEPILSKNELKVLPPVPPVNVTLQPSHQTLPVGVVLSIIGAQVIVEGVEKHNPLNEGSILWITESRSPLGIVDEIFGPVKNPYYMVRYNSDSEVPAGIQQGTLISFVPEFVNHILNNKNLYKKGYDASGENDEEISDEVEFSDDEKEAEYKKMLKMTKRGTHDQKAGNMKKDKKKFKNWGGRWNDDQPSAPPPLAGVGQLPLDQKQYFSPYVTASLDHGNCSLSSGRVQDFTGWPGLVPTFPQLALAPGFTAPSNLVWTNGIPSQQPQIMGFANVFPTTSGMPWLQQNHPQPPYQMPLSNGVPFQQHFDTSQSLPSNFVLPGGQSNFCAGPAFPTWSASTGQAGFNQSDVATGLQAQHGPRSMNGGEHGVPSHEFQMERRFGYRLPPFVPGNTETSKNFSHGRKPYRRGGGRFGGGRGQQQSM